MSISWRFIHDTTTDRSRLARAPAFKLLKILSKIQEFLSTPADKWMR